MTDEVQNVGPWTCFHCGETFTTIGGASDHFGATQDAVPGCLIARVPLEAGTTTEIGRGLLMALRKAEGEIARLRAVNEQLDYEAGHARAMECEIGRLFKHGARSVQDAFNLFDSMEGRALAAEERVHELLEACRRLLKFNEELAMDVGVSTHYPSADFARAVIARTDGLQ